MAPKKTKAKSKKRVSKKGTKARRSKKEKTVQYLSFRDSPFPPVLMTKLKYTDYVRRTTSLSGTSTAVLNINDIYDPVSSGWSINGQPFYHDQLLSSIGPYLKNTVYGAKVKISITNNSASGAASCLINWAASNNYTSPATNVAMAQYAGEPNTSYFPNIGVNGNSTCHRIFKKYFDIAKVIGVTRSQLEADDRYTGSYNTSPVIPVGLQVVSSADPTSANADSDVGYTVKITFYTKCWSLMPLVTAS